MSLDKASMVITGSILPIEIQKKFTGGTFEYDLANDTEGYYYKLTDITTSSTDLIDTGVNYMQFGGSNQGADAGTAMHTTAATDKVKFYISNIQAKKMMVLRIIVIVFIYVSMEELQLMIYLMH